MTHVISHIIKQTITHNDTEYTFIMTHTIIVNDPDLDL